MEKNHVLVCWFISLKCSAVYPSEATLLAMRVFCVKANGSHQRRSVAESAGCDCWTKPLTRRMR